MSRQTLFRRFLRHPGRVGALWPSSPSLCRMMVSRIGVEQAKLVVELGPGTGVITREIIRMLPAGGRFMAVELDELLCLQLRRNFPCVEILHDSASRLAEILRERRLPPADAIISGLPWAVFPESLQREILNAVAGSLAPDGWFTTFAYLQGLMLPAGMRFRRLLGETFGEVLTSSVVWRNLPPAFVYRCRSRE